ncbi:PepSY-associated TM helix domain-containing protein [Caenibius tardaugens]|uniref:PepSY-associated TM helix domain-containing protein n=1 Tax=Caenibius tardaugens TaxID=169176 RepID=UPI0005933878|nr:PepSY-associated TM helix domain-containing protein [Caenibius tardaugens]AZI38236.1 PepSY domain-containing protein [Caenibius tardaugens NBRC 16725]
MKLLDLLHRWMGGLLGLILALLGLSGAILVHKDAWIGLPHAHDPLRPDVASVAQATEALMALPGGPQGIIYATPRFGLHQTRFGEGAGLYADQAGNVVTRWQSQWERPELWLFDFHHHLFTGDFGEWISGIAGLAAVFFVVSGAILWWRTRKTFRFRLWPKRMSRPAIVMQHRDLGIVLAPLLLLSALTGAMLLFRPVAMVVVAPFGPVAETAKALEPPKYKSSGPLAQNTDWRAMLVAAHQRFPEAEFRILSLPRKPGDPIMLRMRQPDEWLPNGRTTLWFDAATGAVLGARDARALPQGAKVFNMAYPLHAGKVGGLAWRIVMTLSGLGMAVLGSFAVWSFWFRRPKQKKRVPAPAITPDAVASGSV